MRMVLEGLHIENFKGIRDLRLDFSDGRTEIAGANGTGKTSVVDAFCWALWNTNANGDAPGSDNFREKPLDDAGQPVHNVDTTVELFCTLDGKRFDLKRTQAESWVKKRGNAEATFQGNVSTYWINGVETKQADYKARIKAIADDEVFRLVGSLSAFNALAWKERRQQLLMLAGNDVDGELLGSDQYRALADEIAQKNVSVDDLKKVLVDERKAINKELMMLPVRIDEAKKSIPEFKANEVRDAEYIINETREDITKVEDLIVEAQSKSGEANRRNMILALEQEIVTIKRAISDDYDAKKRQLQNAANAANEDYLRLSQMLGRARNEIETLQARLDVCEKRTDQLREKYMTVKRKKIDSNDTCPTCGQKLQTEKLAEIMQRAMDAKKAELALIQTDGKAAAAEVEGIKAQIDKAKADEAELATKTADAKRRREGAQAELMGFADAPEFKSDRLTEVTAQLEEVKAQQAQAPEARVDELIARKNDLLAIIDRNKAILAKWELAQQINERIAGYELRQKRLGGDLSEVENKIILAEQFVQDRCSALEDSINRQFPTVRWKLFNTQINGGITDDCTCMIECDGSLVPYSSANTASQIRADMEIVDVLSKRYDVRVPLFIDNAERVNVLPEIDSQTITLAVSTDAELTTKKGA